MDRWGAGWRDGALAPRNFRHSFLGVGVMLVVMLGG
jgi:hypothetical protein